MSLMKLTPPNPFRERVIFAFLPHRCWECRALYWLEFIRLHYQLEFPRYTCRWCVRR
jgi:hypothetical protein